MDEKKKHILSYLNKEVITHSHYTVSVTLLTIVCLVFDLYQLANSDNEWLTLITIFCVIISWLGFLKWTTEEFSWYVLLYIVPCALYILSDIPNGQALGINAAEFQFSALVTVASTLIPPIGGLIVAPISMLVGGLCRYLESKYTN